MPKTIMVVDDEPVALELSRRKLEENGYDVMVAHDGNQALQLLSKKMPDLILLDVQMPGMNGYTFIMERAKLPQFKSIPVIVLTAHNEMEPLFKRHGVKSYLVKPLKLQELLDKVKLILGE